MKLGETYNQKISLIFGQFASVVGCVGISMLVNFKRMSDFWPNLNFPLEQQTKVVLIFDFFRKCWQFITINCKTYLTELDNR